jgi:Bacterial regulatory proteins, tetR family
MPTPNAFSEIAALDAAVDCFWQRGYEATSVRDLAVSMGISPPGQLYFQPPARAWRQLMQFKWITKCSR